MTDEQLEKTYTGLDREIAEEFISIAMTNPTSSQRSSQLRPSRSGDKVVNCIAPMQSTADREMMCTKCQGAFYQRQLTTDESAPVCLDSVEQWTQLLGFSSLLSLYCNPTTVLPARVVLKVLYKDYVMVIPTRGKEQALMKRVWVCQPILQFFISNKHFWFSTEMWRGIIKKDISQIHTK